MDTVVAVAGVVLVVAAVMYFVFARRHPQDAAKSAAHRDDSASRQFFGEHHDRPAGPGAEADGVAGPGQIVPGPSAEAGGDQQLREPPL